MVGIEGGSGGWMGRTPGMVVLIVLKLIRRGRGSGPWRFLSLTDEEGNRVGYLCQDVKLFSFATLKICRLSHAALMAQVSTVL